MPSYLLYISLYWNRFLLICQALVEKPHRSTASKHHETICQWNCTELFIKYWANRYFVCSDPITNCAVAAAAAASQTPHKSYHYKVFALSSYHNLTKTVTNTALIKHTGGFDTVCPCVGSFGCLLSRLQMEDRRTRFVHRIFRAVCVSNLSRCFLQST